MLKPLKRSIWLIVLNAVLAFMIKFIEECKKYEGEDGETLKDLCEWSIALEGIINWLKDRMK